MGILNQEMLTLQDYHQRRDPKGGIAQLVELMSKETAVLQDMPVYPSNLDTGHEVHSRTYLPRPEWGRINKGVKPTKTRSTKYVETIGFQEFMIAIDARQNAGGNMLALRASELAGHAEAMGQSLETSVLYQSTKADPEAIMGLAPRYDDINGLAKNQIIQATPGASGNDFTSIWLVNWGPRKVYGVFPKDQKDAAAGLINIDRGKDMWDDGDGGKFEAYVSILRQYIGVVVEDYRCAARITIKTSDLTASGDVIVPAMMRAIHRVKSSGTGRTVFYANKLISEYLDLQARDSVKNSTLAIKEIGGQPILSLRGIPIRSTEMITNEEASLV